MKVLERCDLNYEVRCASCKSLLCVEPSDWKYIPPQPDISGCMEDACLVANCSVCSEQIVLEERMAGKRGIYNGIRQYMRNQNVRD